MRAINDAKARELGDLDLSINVRMGDNNKHRDKIKDTEKFIVREWDEGRGLRIELGRTGDDISRVTADIKITESLIGQRLADIDDLNRRLNKRIIDIEDRKKDIRITEAEIARANDNIAKAKLDQDKLRCKLDDEIERNHRLNKDNDIEVVKGHKLVGNINDLEVQCKNRDAQIHIMRDEIDKLKHALHASDQCNMNLEDELDALNKHSDLLHKQNSILNSELEDAIANDEFVRRELDRRDKVAMIQRDNDEHLRSSLHMLNDTKARSPARRKYSNIFYLSIKNIIKKNLLKKNTMVK